MVTSTTIQQMLKGNRIFVPTYQRAFSWETELENEKPPKQINLFLSDLEDFSNSSKTTRYYFGHFLFEVISDQKMDIIDGQQRITTIIIFLSALLSRLREIRYLQENEFEIFEDIIKRNSTYHFETVDIDNLFFKDFVIDQIKKDKNGLKTVSQKCIAAAFDFFVSQLSDKNEIYLLKMLDTIQNTSCTMHLVNDESEAIQIYNFQNVSF